MKVISDGGITTHNNKNTFEAVMLTKNLKNIDGVKLDVRISNDNIIVLSEYDDLSKFALSNKKISNSNYDYLKKVKFPSHIFKDYIPKLEDILNKYDNNKIIVLKIYNSNKLDLFINQLYSIIRKYSYIYYFCSNNFEVINKMKFYNYNNLGIILDDESNIKLKKNKKDILLLDDEIK